MQVMMTFLVGNDFIPSLPFFNVQTLTQVYTIYLNVLPKLGGYINQNGVLNLERLGLLMNALSIIDTNQFMSFKGIKKNSAMVNPQAEFQAFKESNTRYNFWLESETT
jgi:5'-3' exonuclease